MYTQIDVEQLKSLTAESKEFMLMLRHGVCTKKIISYSSDMMFHLEDMYGYTEDYTEKQLIAHGATFYMEEDVYAGRAYTGEYY